MGWGAFLVAIAGSVTKRVVVALGLGLVTYTGFEYMKGQIDDAIDAAFTGLPADTYQIIALAGFVDAIGVWLGALTVVATLVAFGKIAPLAQS